MPPVITLTTDFGLSDPFVGIMKGVILSICPTARLIDLTHEVSPQDVLGGCLALEAALPFFPAGTVHLAVVDPGVGGSRRALALRVSGAYLVGPDNGLLSPALDRSGWAAVALEAPDYRLPVVSRTFHGRDVFAPAAAYLAAGVPLERLGPAVPDPRRLALPGCRLEGDALVGEVLTADRFGNLITSIPAARLPELPGRGAPSLEMAGRLLGGLVDSYREAGENEPAMIVGSTGRLEIFVRSGSAETQLGAARGTPVLVRRGASAS